MGSDGLGFEVKIRKVMIISIKTCFRAIFNHPFLVGMMCFLILLYRISPFVFSLLVAASPIFICTAVLLGALLSFGPEIEEEKSTQSKTKVHEKDLSFLGLRNVTKQKDIVHNAATLVNNEENADSVRSMTSRNESSRDIQCEKRVIKEVEKESNDSVLEKKRDIDVENAGCSHKVEGRNFRVNDDNSRAATHTFNKEDESNTPLLSSWKPVGDEEGHDDSVYERAGSSSPDASMADIIPMLDELHPLLDTKVPRPTRLSDEGSDIVSERSHTSSNDGSAESDENTQLPGVRKVDQEDGFKSAIKWTEDDQKNLMNLGTSELERNQRLENLIARRRASKSMKLMNEKNLIDFDSTDLSFGIAPISVTRRNPFDIPSDYYDISIPGSAPSILQPRQNPFNTPYVSNEEKFDLKDDSFQQEFSAFLQRDAFFRRHDSFSAGPSTLGGARPDMKWKPYFIPERLASEGTGSGSLIFERQLSEMSESKMSSVPDSESVCSVVDEEEKKLDAIAAVSHEVTSTLESQSSGDISLDIEQAENRDAHHDIVEIIPGDVESLHERESNLSDAGVPTHLEYDPTEIHSRMEEAVEDCYSSRSSSSSITEPDEKISNVKGEKSTNLENKEPVYDSSPPPGELPVLEAKSMDDIDMAFKQLHEGANVEEVILPSMIKGYTNSVDSHLPALEAKTMNDIDMAFKQLHEGADVEEVILPSMIKESAGSNNNSQLPGFEARSMDDINMAFKQLHEGTNVEEVILPSTIMESTGFADTNSKLPAFEARSMDDIDMAFKQLHEGADIEEVILPSMIKDESAGSADANSRLPALEARSKDDIDMAFKQLHEGADIREVVLPSMIKESIDFAGIKSWLPSFEARSMNDIAMAFKQMHEGIDVEHVILPSMIKESTGSSQLPALEARSMEDIDMAFKQLHEGADVHKVILPSMIKNSLNSADTNSQLPALEAKSVDDINMAFKQLHEGADIHEVILPSAIEQSAGSSDKNSKLPALEAKSVDDINMAFKQLHEGADVHEVILPSKIKESTSSLDKNSQLPALEAKSVDDINMAFKQLHEGADFHEVILPSMIKDSANTSSKLPALEVKSVDDIDMAFKQLHEGADIHELILPSMIKDSADTNSKLPALEAKSVDDIDMAFKQLHEGADVEEVILPSMIKESAGSADRNSQLPALEAKSVDDIDMAFKQLHEGADVEEVILPSMIKESVDSADINSKLPVIEANSVQDMHVALKQASKSCLDGSHDAIPTKTVESSSGKVNVQGISESVVESKSCDHDVVPSKEIESSSGRYVAQESSKESEEKTGEEASSNNSLVVGKEFESSVQGSSKDVETKTGDEAGGSDSAVAGKEVESSAEGYGKDPKKEKGDETSDSSSEVPSKEVKSVWRFW